MVRDISTFFKLSMKMAQKMACPRFLSILIKIWHRQKWYQIKVFDDNFQKMGIKHFLGQVKMCVNYNNVEIWPIFIIQYFINGLDVLQSFFDRMRVLKDRKFSYFRTL